MSNYKGSIQSRVGRPFRVEYVNRAGEQVNPRTGKPLSKSSKFGNKPYARPGSKENGLTTSKNRKFPIKKTGALFGPLTPIKTDPTIDPPPHVCFNCWQPGHKKTNCPRPMVNRFCNNCGRRNEDMRTCPRCKDAHKIWQETVQNRGGEIEEIFIGDDNNEIEEVNDPDEILQELIYQDQKTREQLEYQQRMHAQRETLNSIYKNNTVINEHGAFDDSRNRYIESTSEPYIGESNSYIQNRDPYVNARDSMRDQFVDPLIDGDLYTNEKESFHPFQKPFQQERHGGMAAFKERDSYGHEVELERTSYQGYSNSSSHREERVKTPDPPRINDNWRKAVADASSVSNSDPVQDILLLAKTISHLSPETQDLIMRQVIAERQEQTRRRGTNQEYQDNLW